MEPRTPATHELLGANGDASSRCHKPVAARTVRRLGEGPTAPSPVEGSISLTQRNQSQS